MQLTNGTLLQGGKYRIESVLGQGAYGITYLATTKVKGELGYVPVKMTIKEFFSKELNTRKSDGYVSEVSSDSLAGKYSNMFLREARNLSHLKHDGIVNVLEAFSENNTHYYVMEYVDGGSLDAYIRSKGRLSERETLSLARQIGSALAFMHENKMLHLDLKPKNIMLRVDGTLCLIDFGLSKQYEADGEPESSTTIGLGTPGYAPLEQGDSDDRKTFAPTLDIYAFGATLFKMLTGKTPPRSSDIFNEGFPEEALLSLEISAETISAIRHAMSPRKGDRPQTVEEFLKELVEDRDDIDVDSWDVKESDDDSSEDTELTDDATPLEEDPSEEKSNEAPDSEPGKTPAKSLNKRLLYGVVGGLLAAVVAVLCILWGIDNSEKRKAAESDQAQYLSLITSADSLSKVESSLPEAMALYDSAAVFETQYAGTRFSDLFGQNALSSSSRVQSQIDSIAKVRQQEAEEKHRRELAEAERKRRETGYSNGILKVNSIEYPMVYVSGGSFMMGSDDIEAYSDQKPVHRVTLSSYRIGKYEVTQELWEAVMGSNPSCFKGSRRPVENVSWDDCQTFIRKLNSLTGQTFKLPTEAQWEFAARGGNSSKGYKYSGSNYIDNVGWYYDNSGSTSHNVGTKSPNELGIYDMSGNVREWCRDWYGYGTYSSSSQVDPEGPSAGSERVYRGGSWRFNARDCPVSYRSSNSPDFRYSNLGLRLCL
ncbi:MAG: SUMF1/EgtB/PvdO family nonheme iron enzyme [Bacteroidales bacterium]|nr:SUMF1/EgtB/PvdO family nonheme iron enzyme [Bacteroidales bacterium]